MKNLYSLKTAAVACGYSIRHFRWLLADARVETVNFGRGRAKRLFVRAEVIDKLKREKA